MDTTFIYALCEPDTGEIRYIGKSDDPWLRFRKHNERALRGEQNHRACWIRSVLNSGAKPKLKIIDEVRFSEWQAAEAAYIQFLLDQGCDLVNRTSGGEGGSMPEEVRLKMSLAKKGKPGVSLGCKWSSEAKKRVSLSRKGTRTGGDNPFFGKKHSQESSRKMSASRIGRTHTFEHKANIATSQKIRRDRERVETMLEEMWS